MSKRNIKPNSGKQLYLNQIFSRGMLYTSSEMTEGFAKIIDNYDIAPTGDAASPRLPIRTSDKSFSTDDYIYPVLFKQINKYCYIAFNTTVSEKDYAEDNYDIPVTIPTDTIKVYTRMDNNFNNINEEFIYMGSNNEEAESNELQQLKEDYRDNIEDSTFEINTVQLNGTGVRCITTQAPIYDGENLTTQFVYFKPTQIGIALPEDVEYYDPASSSSITITVTDGDTFSFGSLKIRLTNINTPELGTKWADYTKNYLEKILDYFFDPTQLVYYKIIYAGYNSYDRQVAKVKVYIQNIGGTTYNEFDVGAMLLQLGLASVQYANINDVDYNKYIEASQYAQTPPHNLKLFSTVDIDPYYSKSPTIYGTGGNNLSLEDGQYIEVVKINSENNISAKTKVTTDFVNCVYVDYLDAVGFIGRIIDSTNNKIAYKGPIFIRAFLNDSNQESYSILLPTNQGDGYHPDLIAAVQTGEYNIFNSDPINVSNVTTSKPLTIYSILPLTMESNTIKTDPYEIITKTVAGQQIYLKAQITENPTYTTSNVLTATDNFGFEINLLPSTLTLYKETNGNVDVDEDHEILPSQTITRSINEYSNDTILSLNLTKILSDYISTLSSGDRVSFKTNINDIYSVSSYEDLTWNNIWSTFDKLHINSNINILRQDEKNITINTGFSSAIPLKASAQSLLPDCLLELYLYYEIDSTNAKNLYIHCSNNFSNINLTHSFSGSQLILNNRSNFNPTINFYQQWFVADANSNYFEPISNESLIFTKNPLSSTLVKQGNWGDATTIEKPVDLKYTINRTGNIIFKYSIQPKISCNLGPSCPAALQSLELKNTYQELYLVSNTINVGLTIETVSSESLKQNMDIYNATRINVFNRQIVLYGPYTISNVLFFSKFEVFDYYPFPNNVVEIDEPIIWTYNYKDAFIIFGKYNIYMLSGGTSVLDCKLNKIYENLSLKLSDVNLLGTSGNNLIFFNNGEGYIIIPNTFVDSSSNIRIYKLTERISNFFYNPEEYIRLKFADSLSLNETLNFEMSFSLYIQNNDIFIIDNITINNDYNLVVWFIYNQDYKYWRMYSTTLFDKIIANVIFEAPLNTQFVIKSNTNNYIAYFLNTKQQEGYYDLLGTDKETKSIIQTILNSGYLSVDTMNDKRFKDIIIEFDNITRSSKLDIDCEFFIDGSPMVISDTDILVTNKLTGLTETETDKVFTNTVNTELIDLETTADDDKTFTRYYGKAFILESDIYSISGRTHVRIPVFGKGRLPLFTLLIKSDKYYEFINYALIYKEKNINRRN